MLEFVEGYNDVHKKSSEGLTFEERKRYLSYNYSNENGKLQELMSIWLIKHWGLVTNLY
jgi:hypothetical protein